MLMLMENYAIYIRGNSIISLDADGFLTIDLMSQRT